MEHKSEDEQRLEFFRSLPHSEQIRLACWFHDLIERDVSGLYEWKQAQLRKELNKNNVQLANAK